MKRLPFQPLSIKPLCFLSAGLLLSAAIAHQVQAHEVKVVGDVAGTWHIEPNHNPKVGVPARTWIALTRKGGEILPLDQATCHLAVYTRPRKPGAKPVLTPTLTAVSAERFRGIPGADITFPKVGLYQLELTCSPKKSSAFKPFQMKYDVTVTR
jgi:hypothetical protein